MATISTQLRNFKEPTKEQLNLLYFALPLDAESHGGDKASNGELEKMEISAVLSLAQQGVEEAYVSSVVFYYTRLHAQIYANSQGNCTSFLHTWRSHLWTASPSALLCRCVQYAGWNASMHVRGYMP